MYVSLNGKIVKQEEALISANQAGLFYGAGCFETMRYTNRTIQFWDQHFARLCNGLIYLGVKISDLPISEEFKKNIDNLLAANTLSTKSIKIRLQVFISNEEGYSKPESPEFNTLITVSEILDRGHNYRITTVAPRTIPSSSRPSHLKLSNMLHYRQAFREAKKDGFDDGLMLTKDGFIAETSIANIFWIEGNTVFTPSSECDILPGIIRNQTIEYISKLTDFEVLQGMYTLDHLLKADSVWITNSLMLVKSVNQINQQKFQFVHPVVNQIKEHFA